MEYPIPPGARREERPQPQTQRELQWSFRALLTSLSTLVILTLITSFIFTVARLALVVKKKGYWDKGVPTLCDGVVALLPYGTLDTETAFIFQAISNAIAVRTYGNDDKGACHTTNFSLGLPKNAMHSISTSLIAISAFDIIGIVIIHGICWGVLFASGCKVRTFRWCLAWSLIILALDALAVYESSRTESDSIVALSVIILLCSIAMFLLISWVLQSRINRHKFQGDDLEIPYAIFTPQAATNSTGQVPNMVRMFNPTQS